MTGGAAPGAGPLPLITGHEIWRGDVRLGGTIAIAAGASVTIEPGARVLLSPGSRLLVQGRLAAAGTAERPVLFAAADEAPWEGLWLYDSARADLSHAVLSGVAGDGLCLNHGASAACSDVTLECSGRFAVNFRSTGELALARFAAAGGGLGLAAHGGTVAAEDCSFTGWSETGLELLCEARLDRVRAAGPGLALKALGGGIDASGLELSGGAGAKVFGDARLEWDGGSCAASGDGMTVEGGGAAVLRGVTLRGGERGAAVDAGTLEARECRFEGQTRLSVWCAETGRARLSGCAFAGAPVAAAVRAPLEAAGCSFEAHASAALDLFGPGHAVADCAFAGGGTAVQLDGAAKLSAPRVAGARVGVRARPGAALEWTGGRCEALDKGLWLEGGAASVTGAAFSGGACAAAVDAGTFEAKDVSFERQTEASVRCAEGARARLAGCRFSGAPVAAAARGPLEASGCSFESHAEAALDLLGPGHAAADCAFTACGAAVLLEGEATLSAPRIARARVGVYAREGAKLSWSGGRCEAEDTGLLIEGAVAVLNGASFADGRRALDAKAGKLLVENASFEGQTGVSVWCGESASAALSACRFSGAPTAVTALGPLTARGCELSAHAGAGLELRGKGHVVEKTRLSGCGEALLLIGEAELSDVDASGEDAAAHARPGSRLRWKGGAARASLKGAALELQGAEAELEGLMIGGGRAGLLLAEAKAAARGCSFEGQAEAGARVDAASSLRLDGCRLSGAPTGISARGPVSLSDCRLEGHAALGLDLHGAGHEARGTSVKGCGAGAALDGTARFEGVELSARGAALALRRSSELEWSGGAARSEEHDAAVSQDARARLTGVALAGAGRGALVRGGAWSAGDAKFEGGGKAALEIDGGAHELARASASGADAGLLLSAAECRCEDGRFEGRAAGVDARSGADLEWRGGEGRGATALRLEGARARLDGVRLAGTGNGARVEEGALRLRGGAVEGGRDGAVLVEEGGSADLARCALRGSPVGLAVRAGHAHVGEGVDASACDAPALVAPGAVVCLSAPLIGARAAAARRPLLDFVLRTKSSAFWRPLYKLAYAGAAFGLRARLGVMNGVKAAALHRGWKGGDWEPGISDLDVLVVGTELSGTDGARWLRSFWRKYAGWKRLAPFLGEALVARREEAAAYARAGGSRAAALAASLPGPWPAAAPETSGARLLERAHAYTRLVQCVFDAGSEPWARNARQAAKGFLDVLRFGGAGAVPSRREAASGLASGPASRRRAFEALLGAEPAEPVLALGLAAGEALAALDEGLLLEDVPTPRPGAALTAPADEALDALLQPFAPGAVGALADDLSRSFVVLDAGASRPEAVALALRACVLRRSLKPSTLPVPMSARLWASFAPLPYLDDPTRRLGVPGDGALRERAAGRLLPGSRQAAWGVCAAPVAASPERIQAAAEAAGASFALTWRWLGSPAGGGDPHATFHHLLSRGLGLRLLLERGVELPFYDLDALVERASHEFPELGEPLDRLDALEPGASLEEAFFANYALVDGLSRSIAGAVNEREAAAA